MNGVATWLYAQGHAIDVILGVLLVEAVWLVRWRNWPPGAAVLCLLPGAALLLAVRAALIGLAWPWVALALALSFPAHLADVMSRTRRAG
ncbi:hypothetical protein [Sphingomonas sp. PAMC 26605]|uniref:hypothetical protein n=1 Tax=Sphingomonas sp. PAMC 26605 TaxID=1112214 RepID=UPI00026CDC70|nr:hypothetical protein [Sphingomonas sp. PAMC 26605]